MKREVEQCVVGRPDMDGRTLFCFPEHFIGFQGHFPDQPVLPGVCLIQAGVIAAEARCGCALTLVTIKSAKFFSVVVPDRSITVNCSGKEEMLSITITADDTIIAKLRLEVNCA